MKAKKLISLILLTVLSIFMVKTINVSTSLKASEEIVDKGDRITWVDASVKNPDNYQKIIGFKVKFKLLTDNTNYEDGYGGIFEDPSDPEYNMHYPTYMLVASRGAHDNTDFNENTFFAEEGENYEHYVNDELLEQEICKIGVGSGYYVCGYLDNGIAVEKLSNMKAGDEGSVIYKGVSALFTPGNPIMTFYGYTAAFEILSISWYVGEPIDEITEPWEKVEKETIYDVETVENSADQNGYNYVNIIRPKDAKEKLKVILWIHGGGWTSSTRKDIILNNTKEYFLAKGYAFISAEYTLSNSNAPLTSEEQAKVDACKTDDEKDSMKSLYALKNDTQGKQMIYDLKLAVRFIRANADKYNLDASFICAMGESAGAHLSALLATTNGSEAHEGKDGVKFGGYDTYSSDVNCFVGYSTPTDLTNDSLTTLKYCKALYPLLSDKSLSESNMVYDNFLLAYCLLGYSYIEKHLVSGTIGTSSAKYDDEMMEALRFMSPYYQINEDTPPMYLIHGEKDESVLISQAYALEQKAKTKIGSDNFKSNYYSEATHVDKKYFDIFSQYSDTYKFVEEKRQTYLNNLAILNAKNESIDALKDKVNEAKTYLDNSKYEESSLNTLRDKINVSEELLNKEDVTKEELDASKDELVTAISELVEIKEETKEGCNGNTSSVLTLILLFALLILLRKENKQHT